MQSTSVGVMTALSSSVWSCGEENQTTLAVSSFYLPYTSNAAGLTSEHYNYAQMKIDTIKVDNYFIK